MLDNLSETCDTHVRATWMTSSLVTLNSRSLFAWRISSVTPWVKYSMPRLLGDTGLSTWEDISAVESAGVIHWIPLDKHFIYCNWFSDWSAWTDHEDKLVTKVSANALEVKSYLMLTSAKTESFASSMSWSVNFPSSAHWMESSKADSVPSKLGSLQKKSAVN